MTNDFALNKYMNLIFFPTSSQANSSIYKNVSLQYEAIFWQHFHHVNTEHILQNPIQMAYLLEHVTQPSRPPSTALL